MVGFTSFPGNRPAIGEPGNKAVGEPGNEAIGKPLHLFNFTEVELAVSFSIGESQYERAIHCTDLGSCIGKQNCN